MSKENINITIVAEPTLLQWLAFGVSIAAVLVAIVTAGGVILNAWLSRKTARQQATLEFLEEYKNNKHQIDLLNKFEMLAVGINHKIYDEQMIFEVLGLDIVGQYEASKSLIAKAREEMRSESKNYEDVYVCFESMAKKFRDRLDKRARAWLAMGG